MAKRTGLSVTLLVNTGTVSVPIWTAVGGQRNLSRELSATMMDASDKVTAGANKEYLAGFKDSSLTLDCCLIDSDASVAALRGAYNTGTSVLVRVAKSAVAVEQADALLMRMSEEAPYEDVYTASIELQITGGWASAA